MLNKMLEFIIKNVVSKMLKYALLSAFLLFVKILKFSHFPRKKKSDSKLYKQ
jgi:hypothetical protein